MFVVTVHSFYGSAVEAARPSRAYLFTTREKARAAAKAIDNYFSNIGEDMIAFVTELHTLNAPDGIDALPSAIVAEIDQDYDA